MAIHPLNCREASRSIALGIDRLTFFERAMVRFHMAICFICRKYERQLQAIGAAYRLSLSHKATPEELSTFKGRLRDALDLH